MTINGYAKKWCEEDYDVRREDFFVDNAYYVAKREWVFGGLKHGIFALLIAVATMILSNSGFFDNLLMALVLSGIATTCFVFYGIRSYNANSMETALGYYILLAILGLLTIGRVDTWIKIVFAILSFVIWVYFTIVNPILFIKVAKSMKERIIQEEMEDERKDKQSYSKWEHDYKAYRYGLPEAEPVDTSDPVMKHARELFTDFGDTKAALKARYRQLAKQYHPDKGGDTHLFQCIITVYEDIAKNLTN